MLVINMIHNPYYITYLIFFLLLVYSWIHRNSGTNYLPKENCPAQHKSQGQVLILWRTKRKPKKNQYYQIVERIKPFTPHKKDLPFTIVSVTSICRFFVQYVGYKVIHCIQGWSFTNVQNVQEFH